MLRVSKKLAICFMLGENTEKNLVGFFVRSKMIKNAFLDFKERESEDSVVVHSQFFAMNPSCRPKSCCRLMLNAFC